jgi:hypothetical protein
VPLQLRAIFDAFMINAEADELDALIFTAEVQLKVVLLLM